MNEEDYSPTESRTKSEWALEEHASSSLWAYTRWWAREGDEGWIVKNVSEQWWASECERHSSLWVWKQV